MVFDYSITKKITNQDFSHCVHGILPNCQAIEKSYNSGNYKECIRDVRELNEQILRYIFERLFGHSKKNPMAGEILLNPDFILSTSVDLVKVAEDIQSTASKYIHKKPLGESDEQYEKRMKILSERAPKDAEEILEKFSSALKYEISYINDRISSVRGKLSICHKRRLNERSGKEESVLEADLQDVVDRKDYKYVWKVKGQNKPLRENTYWIRLSDKQWAIDKTIVLEAINNNTNQTLIAEYIVKKEDVEVDGVINPQKSESKEQAIEHKIEFGKKTTLEHPIKNENDQIKCESKKQAIEHKIEFEKKITLEHPIKNENDQIKCDEGNGYNLIQIYSHNKRRVKISERESIEREYIAYALKSLDPITKYSFVSSDVTEVKQRGFDVCDLIWVCYNKNDEILFILDSKDIFKYRDRISSVVGVNGYKNIPNLGIVGKVFRWFEPSINDYAYINDAFAAKQAGKGKYSEHWCLLDDQKLFKRLLTPEEIHAFVLGEKEQIHIKSIDKNETDSTFNASVFFLKIEDMLEVAGHDGVTVLGKVIKGNIKTNNSVDVIGFDSRRITAKVSRIENSKGILNCAYEESTVGITLSGIKKAELQNAIGIVNHGFDPLKTEFKAVLYVLKKEEGGYNELVFNNFYPYIYISAIKEFIKGIIKFDNQSIEYIKPGQFEGVSVYLDKPGIILPNSKLMLYKEKRATSLVAEGVVTEF